MPISRTAPLTQSLTRVFVATMAASLLSFGLVGCSMLNSAQEPSDQGSSNSTDENTSKPDDGDDSGDSSSDAKALEKFAASERAQIPAILKQTSDVYSDASVETKAPGTIIFTYVYAAQIDPEVGAEYFDGKISSFQDICDDQVFPAMEKAGIKGPKHAVYVYKNPDGSTIWEKDFPSNP